MSGWERKHVDADGTVTWEKSGTCTTAPNARMRLRVRIAPGDRGAVMSAEHGTNAAYEGRGCRCDECLAFQRNRVKRNRADRLASGRLNHGRRSAYDAGCRCEQCREVRIRIGRRDAARRKS